MTPGVLYVVATPIGNLADASPRALDTLRAAHLVACEDTRTTRTLLARHGVTARTVALHEHNEKRAAASLLAPSPSSTSLASGGKPSCAVIAGRVTVGSRRDVLRRLGTTGDETFAEGGV